MLAVARVAGIQAAKQTPDLIPLCHPLLVGSVFVNFRIEDDYVEVEAQVETVDRTGVEMEALTACSVAGLTIYDMCKSVDRGMIIGELALWEKTGGRTGTYRRADSPTTTWGSRRTTGPARPGPHGVPEGAARAARWLGASGHDISTRTSTISLTVPLKRSSEREPWCLLLLAVVWAAVLMPPSLQARREARPSASIRSFRSQLWSLQRATPTYGDAYAADDSYDSDADLDAAPLTGPGSGRRSARSPARPRRCTPSTPVAARPHPGPRWRRAWSVPSCAVPRTRAPGGLSVAARRAHASAVAARSSACWCGGGRHGRAGGAGGRARGDRRPVADTLLVAYVALLIHQRRRAAERTQKVRFLRPSGPPSVGGRHRQRRSSVAPPPPARTGSM